jgi:hypothetical protein
LHKDMNLVYKAARDFITPDVANVWIDDPQEAERVRDFMRLLGPQYVERIKPYPNGAKLFADFKIDEEVAKLMKPTAKLPSGGSIVIETTEALTVIDVNSGKFTGGKNLDDTIVKTNIEAAAEIARQVRLRDIGGIIVCDFIDMSSESDRNRVIKSLEDGLRKDRTRSTIQSFSPLGLLEFTRKRVGKDLAGQLRSACPTCNGLGSVLSPESVTISTFREIAHHRNGHAGHVHVAASPQVAAQIEFWYEDELRKLSESVATPIDVRVDPTAHPESPRVVWGAGLPELTPIRVGDEYDVDLLNTRLPIATSAAAVVNGRLIEVENAANAAGQAIKIRILDVDGAEIIAEPRFPIGSVPAVAGEGKKRRRRGGRGRKPLTIAEQQEELRELAEEAAKGLGSRPVPVIGISTTEEAVAEERVARNEGAPKRNQPPLMAAELLDAPSAHPPRGRQDRSGRPAAAAPAPKSPSPRLAPLPGESLSGALVAKLPGESLSGDRVTELLAPPAPVRSAAPAAPARLETDEEGAPASEGDAPGRKRRRRRRRGGRGGSANGAVLDGAGAPSPAAGDEFEGEEDDDDVAVAAVAAPNAVPETVTEVDGRRRRRRRRRRRGGSGAAAAGVLGANAPLADRHIISVDGEGGAHPTGEVAPQPPNRAIAPWNRPKKGEIAIEPPPPSLSAPAEPSEEIRVAAPTRRPRTTRSKPPAAVEAAPIKALPAPARKKAVATAKKTAVKKTSAKASTAKKATSRKATPAKKTSTRKKTS